MFSFKTLRGIRYKLQMLGVRLARTSYIFVSNMAMVHSTHRFVSTLKKKLVAWLIVLSRGSGDKRVGNIVEAAYLEERVLWIC